MLLGAALSVYQNSGDAQANWAHFERRLTWHGWAVDPKQRIGRSVDFWNRYAEDIARARDLGMNALRLSVEWSRLEPAPGRWDMAAFDRYHAIFDCIRQAGMTPMATLHHFVHPQWFEARGGFERAENLGYFYEHCRRSVGAFGDRVKLWATFNEPTVLCLMGYVLGLHAPGKTLRLDRVPHVLGHLLRAHCDVYRDVKAMHPGLQVGLVHSMMRFQALPGTPRYVRAVADLVEWAFAQEPVLRFFETGSFEMGGGTGGAVVHDVAPADFLGLNYYSRVLLDRFLRPTCMPGETMTDMPYASHPQGFKQALARIARVGLPVYVTENGISDERDDRRADFIRDYLAQYEQALDEGLDLRGYFYWTLIDNFEWDQGFTQHFGLYDRDRRLRAGAQALVDGFARLRARP